MTPIVAAVLTASSRSKPLAPADSLPVSAAPFSVSAIASFQSTAGIGFSTVGIVHGGGDKVQWRSRDEM